MPKDISDRYPKKLFVYCNPNNKEDIFYASPDVQEACDEDGEFIAVYELKEIKKIEHKLLLVDL